MCTSFELYVAHRVFMYLLKSTLETWLKEVDYCIYLCFACVYSVESCATLPRSILKAWASQKVMLLSTLRDMNTP